MNAMRIISAAAAVLGMSLCLYPAVARIHGRHTVKDTLAQYTTAVNGTPEKETAAALADAKKYNDKFYETGVFDAGDYDGLLNLSGTGIMGSIEIPKIRVNLPIVHGTENEVLQTAAGHLRNSSLPVGGENTHAVLCGHRGLPGAELFTRLDELEKGDLFLIYAGKETLAYEVRQIDTVNPDDDILNIEPGKDKVSLVTCTPYGINTRRLVVTGERVPYNREDSRTAPDGKPSAGEIFLAALPCCMAAALIITAIRRKRKEGDKNEKP